MRKKKDWLTYAELTRKLGKANATMQKYRKHPDWSDNRSVEEIRIWIDLIIHGRAMDGPGGESVMPEDVAPRKRLADMYRSEYESELARIKVEQEKGLLMNREEIERDNSAIAEALKNSLLTIGSRLHQQVISLLADPADGAQVEQMADDLVRGALSACNAALDKHEAKKGE